LKSNSYFLLLNMILILCSNILTYAADRYEELINTTQLALLDSNVTDEFPAVGQLISEYEDCTGTLIAPSLILTAAHCINDIIISKTKNKPFSGSLNSLLKFKIKLENQTYYYTVVYGYSFRNKSNENDIGIVQLSNQVPLKLVTPLELEGSIPNGSVPMAVLGFGCNKTKYNPQEKYFEAAGGETAGMKQIVNQSVGSLFYQLCTGDSGGPLINLNNNKIFAIGSSYFGSFSDSRRKEAGFNTSIMEDLTPFYQTVQKIIEENNNYCTNEKYNKGKPYFIKGQCVEKSDCNAKGQFFQIGNCPNHESSFVCCSSNKSKIFTSFRSKKDIK